MQRELGGGCYRCKQSEHIRDTWKQGRNHEGPSEAQATELSANSEVPVLLVVPSPFPLWYLGDMPIYEYECAKCGKKIEVIQKMSDKPLKKHAECGGVLTKLISAAGFQFKGAGWYVTDYARKGSGGDASETQKEQKTEAKDTSSN